MNFLVCKRGEGLNSVVARITRPGIAMWANRTQTEGGPASERSDTCPRIGGSRRGHVGAVGSVLGSRVLFPFNWKGDLTRTGVRARGSRRLEAPRAGRGVSRAVPDPSRLSFWASSLAFQGAQGTAANVPQAVLSHKNHFFECFGGECRQPLEVLTPNSRKKAEHPEMSL